MSHLYFVEDTGVTNEWVLVVYITILGKFYRESYLPFILPLTLNKCVKHIAFVLTVHSLVRLFTCLLHYVSNSRVLLTGAFIDEETAIIASCWCIGRTYRIW